MDEFSPLRDRLDATAARLIAARIRAVYPNFDSERFVESCCMELEGLGLMERVAAFAEALREFLPNDYPTAVGVIVDSLAITHTAEGDELSREFQTWPFAYFVEAFGLDHWDASFAAMYEITQHGTAEWAIRPFITADQRRAFKVLERWSGDQNEHIRRLTSEGIRPRLPWGKQLPALIADPSPALAHLERLRDDPSRYVQRSVANCLNDVSKDHPELVLELIERWHIGATPQRSWIIKHALRNFIKQGEPRALALLGFNPNPTVEISQLRVDQPYLRIGETLSFSIDISNTSSTPQPLVVDFAIDFVKANGKHSRKVFKLRTLTLQPTQTTTVSKRFVLQQRSTRQLFPGGHQLSIQINGRINRQNNFSLSD